MGVPAGFKDFPDLIQFDSGQSQGISIIERLNNYD